MKEHFGWFFSLCRMLERFLGTEYCFTTAYQHQVYREKDYDLIYPLEFNLVEPEQVRTPAKYVTGIRSHLTWVRKDFIEIVKLLRTRFQRVHTVSRRLQRVFAPQVPGVVRVTHGVDTEFFVASTQADQSGSRLRLGWAGNRLNSSKGFEEFVLPLEQLPGVELIFCGYQDRNLDVHQMRAFYDSLDAYVCTSDLEGNNNALMEAAAMQRAIITTDNGTVPEYLRHGESAIIVERAPDRFREAVLQLRGPGAEGPARRRGGLRVGEKGPGLSHFLPVGPPEQSYVEALLNEQMPRPAGLRKSILSRHKVLNPPPGLVE